MRVRGAWAAAALLTGLWATPLSAKKDGPTITVSEFKHYPENMNYFADSDVLLFQDYYAGNVYRSTDAGASWERVADIPEGSAMELVMHDFDSNRAFVITDGIQHYRTLDRGKKWEMWQSDAEPTMYRSNILEFHAGDPNRIIFNGMDCQSFFCEEVSMYTTDGFNTAAKFLRGSTSGCWWAKSSPLFATGQDDLNKDRILCIVMDMFSPFKQDQRLFISDNFFSAVAADGVVQEFEPDLDGNRPVQGIVNIATVKKYLMAATTSMNTDEMALFVTDDTIKWHRAMFPSDHRVYQEAYTVLESTNYSIQIDVLNTRPSNPMGVLFTSNSNGTYFTRNIEHTNRNERGHVDFEKIAGIQGIFLVNTVENSDDVLKSSTVAKKVVTEITFDDGRTFAPVTAGEKRIHLHSVTELDNVGRVFSSPAPGLVMGNGNTGDYLASYADASLFISDDAGVTWIAGPEGPHKYEFGDQGSILVAVADSDAESVSEIKYSLNHGKDWTTAELPDKLTIKPFVLTTTQDSTSQKFILVGKTGDGDKTAFQLIAIDFDGLHERTCSSGDMEDWFARVDSDGNPTCLMGHTQKYQRRKKDADCFLKDEFDEAIVETTDCDCEDHDFECDYNFVREEENCVAKGPIVAPDDVCKGKGPDDTFQGSSGWRLIPGNTCKRESGKKYPDDLVERKCEDSLTPPTPPASGQIDHLQYSFSGDWDSAEVHYLERGESSSSDDETVIARPISGGRAGDIYITHDHGKSWSQPDVLKDARIWSIIPHAYFKDMVFFVTQSREVIYTVDRGLTFHSFEPPYPPAVDPPRNPFAFHPDRKDWLIWMGEKCDDGKSCFLEASVSKDRGDNWETIARYVERCEFTGSSAYKYRNEKQIMCLKRTREDYGDDNPKQLVTSNDFFDTQEVRETHVKDFATMAEFIVVATEDANHESLRAVASLDGENFAEAQFPYNFEVPHQHEYTVLDSSTHAVNLFVLIEAASDRKYGTIIKSNSNGTSYVLSVSGVNCNDDYYVDFEKMLGLEGVIMVNVVTNKDQSDEPKKLQSKISHNDGAEWAYLPPPAQDADGKSYSCSSAKGTEDCALHIQGFSARDDYRKTYSSEGAVGLMLGWGNVGSHLGDAADADTFLTTDAGISWREVKKGRWTWQFGDQGSIIVLVQTSAKDRAAKSKTLYYSTDQGASWLPYDFAESEVEILDVTTLRSGSSRNFLLWGRYDDEVFSINVDFSGLTDSPCVVSDNADESDYWLWSPKHPMQTDDCLFGHVAQYLRKKTDRACYNGYRFQHLYNIQNCSCTRSDYECDYNFELDNHGACRLVQGLPPLSEAEWCAAHPDAVDWYEPTGYRRVPLSTCQGGSEYDRASTPHPCPGHEDDFEKEHRGPSAIGIFFAVLLPVAAAAAVGWWVWRNWSGKFGQIRLGEGGGAAGGGVVTGVVDPDAPWIRYPLIAISGVVAVVAATPAVVAALWRAGRSAAERWGLLRGGSRGAFSRLGGGVGGVGGGAFGAGRTARFTTRDSFSRGRADYAVVDEDEGELLGEESDEEV